MGKGDFLSPKAIANRQKSKGLQKLRFYCQLCQKQCRDENGFKCHTTSEGHKRMMMVFGENPEKFIEGYSDMFQASFLEQLRVSHPFSRVHANEFYQEFIRNKEHIHMNSTKWLTLSDFVKHLGKEGLCKVDETDKGWYVQLIRREADLENDDEIKRKKERAMADQERRRLRQLAEQIEKARAQLQAEGLNDGEEEGEGEREGEEEGEEGAAAAPREPVSFQLVGRQGATVVLDGGALPGDEGEEEDPALALAAMGGHKKNVLASMMEEEQRKKREEAERAAARAKARREAEGKASGAGRGDEPWLHKGIIVKIVSKALEAHGYYKKKAEVVAIPDRFVAELEVLDSGDVLRVDQRELETVVPQVGGEVVMVRGEHRGQRGSLVGIDTDKFRARIAVDGREVWMEYEGFSKAVKTR